MTVNAPSRSSREPAARLIALTCAALGAFALNSFLCRAALANRLIDPLTFTLVRIGSGAMVLLLLARSSANEPAKPPSAGLDSLASPTALVVYALAFSLAYADLSAGTGAFVVFCGVQVTMIGWDLRLGARLRLREGLGLGTAVVGLAWLTRPGAGSPNPAAVALMALSGLAWGVYSLRGRAGGPPLQATSRNFLLATPLAALACAFSMSSLYADPRGLALAAVSGGITSGLGYVAWYAALPSLTRTRASILQLSVPPLTAILGVLLLGESLSPRLLVAAPLILAGIAMAVSRPETAPSSAGASMRGADS